MTKTNRLFAILMIAATICLAASFVFYFDSTRAPSSTPTIVAQDTIPLLAVSVNDQNNITSGGIAYLTLKIINGSGNVYVHAQPFTKIDTQATTKFAKQYACSISSVDCSKYDFLYSIHSESPIVGGPSAGAAMTAVTVALLNGKKIPSGISMTGTISSGGIIGNVGGVKEKITAARDNGLRMVIIPSLSDYNESIPGIEVKRASTVKQALSYMNLGLSYNNSNNITIPSEYTARMKQVAGTLCSNNLQQLNDIKSQLNMNSPQINDSLSTINDLFAEANVSESQGNYYTAASRCFNIRVNLNYLRLLTQFNNLTTLSAKEAELPNVLETARNAADTRFNKFQSQITFNLNSIQIYSIVKERHDEAIKSINDIETLLKNSTSVNTTQFNNEILYQSAYSLARVDSMMSWMNFVGYDNNSPRVNVQALKNSCAQKVNELSEKKEYVAYSIGTDIINADTSYSQYIHGDYAQCIYSASLEEARASVIMSSYGVSKEKIPILFSALNNTAYHAIAEQTGSGNFPVMAYSYYQYAQSLNANNTNTALLYLEDAIQLSGLDLYFPEQNKGSIIKRSASSLNMFWFFLGLSLGLILTTLLIAGNERRNKKQGGGNQDYRGTKSTSSDSSRAKKEANIVSNSSSSDSSGQKNKKISQKGAKKSKSSPGKKIAENNNNNNGREQTGNLRLKPLEKKRKK